MKSETKGRKPAGPKGETREERIKAALRENLKRRKQKARAQREEEEPSRSGKHDEGR